MFARVGELETCKVICWISESTRMSTESRLVYLGDFLVQDFSEEHNQIPYELLFILSKECLRRLLLLWTA